MRHPARGLALAAPLALALAAGAAAQAPALPRPGGPHPVGTSVHALVDSARPDLASGRPGREVRVQAWYPRVPGAGPTAPYLPDAGVLDAMLERGYNRLEPEELRRLADVRTHARIDAPVRRGAGRLPVLVLSHGLGVSRSGYTALAQELASHGYLVVTADHPYGGVLATRGGRIVTSADDPGDLADEAVLARRTVEWAGDASLVLDRLADAESALGRRFATVADTRRAGMVGHSLGGAAALEACRTDPRFRACVDMDGLPFGPVREHGVGAPALVLLSSPVYSDEELAARGRTREQWEEMGRARHATFDSIFAKTPGFPAWVVEVRGTGHMSFGDAPFVLPSMVTRFGGTPIAPARGHALLSGYVRGFFDRFLRGRRGGPLDGDPVPPEVRVRCYGAAGC